MEMYENEIITRTFDSQYYPKELLHAQQTELEELKKIILAESKKKGHPISILDIGIGNARVPKQLSETRGVWKNIAGYHGIDNSEKCIEMSNSTIQENKIDDRVVIQRADAQKIGELKEQYDLIITTWFTAGNFFPENFSFKSFPKKTGTITLETNKKFETIFKQAYEMLPPDGVIVIGSCYVDNFNTQKLQEQFYKNCGMTIITTEKDSFTATAEGFWSQRFTREKIQKYFHFVPKEKIEYRPLDSIDYAMMVIIRK